MFKKFSSEDVSIQDQVKASVQRKIRQSIAEECPGFESVLDDIFPKKSPLILAKCQNHLSLVLVHNVPLFFSLRDGPYIPTLRLLHQYPNIMKKLQVDRGAIKLVLTRALGRCHMSTCMHVVISFLTQIRRAQDSHVFGQGRPSCDHAFLATSERFHTNYHCTLNPNYQQVEASCFLF